MSYPRLTDFLDELGRAGELSRIDAEVQPALELAEITTRIAQKGGEALLFGAPTGYDVPVATQILGTEKRICRALGVRGLDELAGRLAQLIAPPEPDGWFERVKTIPTRSMLGKFPPRMVNTGPCQQVVRLGDDVDLAELPALQTRPEEPPGVITAGVFFTVAPDTQRPVVGRFDAWMHQRDRVAVAWAPQDAPARALEAYAARGEPMPAAIVLGGDPALLLAAMAPLPSGVDALAFAGWLGQKPLEMVAGRSVPFKVPAEAEIVLEGAIDPKAPPYPAGPACTPLGYYAHPWTSPELRVMALTHRLNPVFPAIVPSKPPNEETAIQRALWRVFLPLVQLGVPELVDYDLPDYGGARQVIVVSIRKTHPGQARRVAYALWGNPSLVGGKLLILVDEDVDVHDFDQVGAALAARMHPERDVFFSQGPPDPWDPASPAGGLSSRMAIDATTKLEGECSGSPPRPATMPEEIRRLVTSRWVEYGLGPET